MGKLTTISSAVFLAIGGKSATLHAWIKTDVQLTGFLFGYDSGIITSTIAQPRFVAYFNNPSDTVDGGIVSSFQGGAIAGTMVTFLAADRLGRKKTIALGAAIATLGCALQAGAVAMSMLIIGRFIAGIAVGILSSTVPMVCQFRLCCLQHARHSSASVNSFSPRMAVRNQC